jgi:nucleoside-diphosphate kinase
VVHFVLRIIRMRNAGFVSAIVLMAVAGSVSTDVIAADESGKQGGSGVVSGEKDKKMGNKTFAIIKPGAVDKAEEIKRKITESGFKIVAHKMVTLSIEQARNFYVVHKDRPFYDGLCEYMSSGPIEVIAIEKEEGEGEAVGDFRELLGATNPAEAAEGTIRKAYGTDVQRNAVHGSDSRANAQREIGIFFPELVK